MTRSAFLMIAALPVAALSLAGCQRAPSAANSDVRIVNVAVQKGTVSDDMILLDTIGDQPTAIDARSNDPLYGAFTPVPSRRGADAEAAMAPKTSKIVTQPDAKLAPARSDTVPAQADGAPIKDDDAVQ